MSKSLKFAALSSVAALVLIACAGESSGEAVISETNKNPAETVKAVAETMPAKSADETPTKKTEEKDMMAEASDEDKASSEMDKKDEATTDGDGDDKASDDVNAPYNAFLGKYVTPSNGINLVKYNSVTDADHETLKAYIKTLSNTDYSGFSQNEIMAYWFNLYNAETLNVVLDNYPVSSIKKIGFGGPWDKKLLTVNGKEMSLNNIEHDTVRANYDEPRVHFAFNCGSIGCPNLKMTAWTADSLDADLDKAARDYVASPRGVTIDDGKIIVSSIFKWYKEDFGDSEQSALKYLAQYASGDKKAGLESAKDIDKFDYDWDLNEVK